MDPDHVTIGYVGGGSRQWALRLMTDLALDPDLGGELRLFDIDGPAARHNEALGGAIFSRPEARGRFRVRAAGSLGEALEGADFVVVSIEPGPTEARHADLVVPACHGILQTVGDTTGPGGILRALRAVPMMEEIAKAVMEGCPNAFVINYTNPMTLCTAALYAAAPSIKAHGCCHEVFAVQERVAAIIAGDRSVPSPGRREVFLDVVGVNHFTMATSVKWRGEEVLPLLRDHAEAAMEGRAGEALRARARRDAESWFECDGLVAFEFLRRFGVLGAAGDRHLAEFVPWFLMDEASIHSYGVPLTPYDWRIKVRDAPRPSVAAMAARRLEPSGEEGVEQMRALLGLGAFRTNLNLPNKGQWPQAPLGAVVETNALLEEGRVTPLVAADLPPSVMALEGRVIAEQALVLEAALRRDSSLAFEALLLDPLVRLPPDKAEAMFREMLLDAAPWLPGWKPPAGR